MSKLFNILSILVIGLIISSSFQLAAKDKIKLSKAQKAQHKIAFNLLDMELYDDAILEYNKLLDMRSDYDQFLFETGIAYLRSPKDFDKAEMYFQRALKFSAEDTIPELYYYLAKSYQVNHKFDKAKEAYSNFIPTIKPNKAGMELKSNVQWDVKTCQHGVYHVKLNTKNPLENKKKPLNDVKKFYINATDYVVLQNMGANINSIYDDETAVFLNEESEIFYTSKRNPFGTTTDLSSNPGVTYEHVYTSNKLQGDWKTPHLLSAAKLFPENFELDPENHVSIVSVNKDESIMFLFVAGVLYESKREGKSWTTPSPLPEHINLKKSHEPSVCINDDGNKLIIVSDKKGGYGGRDLYTSTKQEDGTWGALENMGAVVNTEQDEDTPFLIGNDLLYFSSKGHSSIGGYDVFFTEFKKDKWKNPVSLGIPINTPGDEVSYMRSKIDNELAYYASSRLNGYGYKDIYRVTAHYEKREDLLPEILLAELMSDELAAKEKLNDKKDTTTIAEVVEEVIAEVIEEPKEVVEEKKEPVKTEPVVTEKKDATPPPEDIFRDILFKFNKMEIADESKSQIKKIAEYMKQNPDFVVNLAGHADYLGSDEVNMEVSKKRALVVFNELMKDGADPYRVHYDYLGESKPKASGQNADGSDNAENRAKNRRVDFGLEQLNMYRYITYTSGSSSVNTKGKTTLDEVASYVKAHPGSKLDLRGFSDPSGPAAANMILSEKRTKAAVDYLISIGISGNDITSKAFGETKPAPANMPAEYNRRVEIRIK